MFFGLFLERKELLEFWRHSDFDGFIVEIILEFESFLFRITKNCRQQNIPLDGNISFSFDEFIDLRDFLTDHGSKLFLGQSSAREFLLEELSWMLHVVTKRVKWMERLKNERMQIWKNGNMEELNLSISQFLNLSISQSSNLPQFYELVNFMIYTLFFI